MGPPPRWSSRIQNSPLESSKSAARRQLVFLADPLRVFHAKGEVKPRYYNPGDIFSEVHFISPAVDEIAPAAVQAIVGNARIVIHPLGPSYYASALVRSGRLGTLIRHISPDVIRAYDPGLRGALAVHWGRRLGIPSVISVHADCDEQRRYEPRARHWLRRVFERYALPRADVVICVSRHVAAYVRRYRARDVTVVYNRVYTDQFVASPRARLSGLTILSVGRLVPQKYQECLIRAVHPLDARLILIGDGPLRNRLQSLVERLAMQDRVTFRSAVPHAEMPRYYREADIFAIATHYEGFCIPVLEAMAAGLPVVASRIPPIEEILGDAGVLVENRPEAFRAALARLVADADLRAKLGENARQRALTMEGARMEQRECAVYSSLLGTVAGVQCSSHLRETR